MKLLAGIAGGLIVIFSILFIVFEQYGLMDTALYSEIFIKTFQSPGGKILGALIIIALLTVDLFIPVPSSVLMTFSGYYLGFATGSLVNILGSMGATLLGFFLTRLLGQSMFQYLTGDKEMVRVERFFNRYGIWAILLSRPVPMMMETISCLAGLSKMSFYKFFWASFAGTVFISLVYAWAGTLPGQGATGLELPLLIAFVLPGVGFLILNLFNKSGATEEEVGMTE